MLSAAVSLPVFAPSYGHTYFPPVQKPLQPSQITLSQQSKETTPMPGSQPDTSQKGTKTLPDVQATDFQDTRTLLESINMSLRYGKEYMNEVPLVGEPGNFRLSKTKEALAPPSAGASQVTQSASQPASTKKASPAPSPPPPPPPPPPIQTDVSTVGSKKSAKGSEKSPTTPASSQKAKRRKSKPAINVTG
jgi:mediator of RNA polymerase II transcription subunit 6